MSTSNKLTYLNETKNKLKEAINLTNANITNDTFRSYEYKLKKGIINTLNNPKAVWDNFEKVESAEIAGSITLEPTEYAPMELSFKGQTQQDSTTGKQLIDINSSSFNTQTTNGVTITNMGDGSIKLNGTVTGNEFSVRVTAYIPSEINSGIKYYLKANTLSGTSDTYSKILFGNLNGGSINPLINSKNEEDNFTTSSNYDSIWLYIYAGTGKTFNNLIIKPILSTFEDAEWEKYTGNAPSPNPDYPQDIHIVSGDNTIKICGKNLFDKSKVINGRYVNSTTGDLSVGTADYNASDFISVSTGDYIWGATSSSGYHLAVYDENKTFIRSVGRSLISAIKITIGNNEKYVRYTVTTADLNTQQFERGSTATEYEAYQGNSQLISLGVKNYCSSVTKPANANLKFIIDKSISKTFTISFTTNEALNNNSLYLEVDGTSYGNIGGITASANTRATKTYTLSNENYQAIQSGTTIDLLLYKNGANFDIPNDAQIEAGSKANSYSPYGASYIELNKISTYQDYIYKDNDRWILHKEIGKVVLNGSESWNSSTANYYTIIDDIMLRSSGYSNYFINSTTLGTFGYFRVSSTQHWLIFMAVSLQYTSQEWKTWLSTHNTIVYYVLSTPTDTEITDTILLEQLDNFYSMQGQTNISQENNDLPFIIKAKTIKEIVETVD